MSKLEKCAIQFVRYLYRTRRNKLVAMLLIAIGVLATCVGKDATGLVFLLFLALPMFFSKEDWFKKKR